MAQIGISFLEDASRTSKCKYGNHILLLHLGEYLGIMVMDRLNTLN